MRINMQISNIANVAWIFANHYWKPFSIGSVGICLSVWLFFIELSHARITQMSALQEESRAAIALINLKIKTSEQYLFSLKGFFSSRGKINKLNFHDYIHDSNVLS